MRFRVFVQGFEKVSGYFGGMINKTISNPEIRKDLRHSLADSLVKGRRQLREEISLGRRSNKAGTSVGAAASIKHKSGIPDSSIYADAIIPARGGPGRAFKIHIHRQGTPKQLFPKKD